ncbi:MAG TPA: exodeoxyribonuclease VII large subunit, partial [Longimicrobiaceae bacterium]|nr:exodeoxyribonuclease VII large subunit [Longimicrobiaceae bacterium]
VHAAALSLVATGRRRAEEARATLDGSAKRMLERRSERMHSAARQLNALSPLAALGRGFALPQGPDGRVLRRVEHFPAGSAFDLRVHDGVVPCRVDEREPFTTPESR